MNLRNYFPLNTSIRPRELSTLILCVVVYLIISAVANLAASVLGWLPLLGTAADIIAWLISAYCLAGIAFGVYDYFKQ